ncbi:sugar transferase [Dyadobacter tibetensis]|uniref:sugar transferase n=1 Tax=Dyadobacter tibetensis TaxID=1211851 RepID=UPI00046FB10D|nr:sugar transferase [Dyadobacter tibetensis]
MYRRYGKRAMDLCLSLLAMVLLWPLACCLGLLVFLYFRENPIFRQRRPGKDGILFTIYKFRSMPSLRDSGGKLFPDSQRITPFGNWLRASSLDEMPQVWNVFTGNMSLVGPRPLLPEYLPLYNISQGQRHRVRPGITGWAQVNGRNAISWKSKLNFDTEYVVLYSFPFDCKILAITLRQMIGKRQVEYSIVEKFNGN